jgi:nitrate reductase delta subunit
MKMTLRALSKLLAYPSAELQANIGALRGALAAERVLPRSAIERLEPLLSQLENLDLMEAQSAYTDLFDRLPKLSLHLFEHVHGESRERGQAMVDLGQRYMAQGFLVTASELPDFLPLFLEFASCMPAEQARHILAEPAHVLAALEARLVERGSAYAAVFHAVIAAAGARPDAEALAQLQAAAQDSRSLDETWEEAPVDFTRPAAASTSGAGSGVIARIRMMKRTAAKLGGGGRQ